MAAKEIFLMASEGIVRTSAKAEDISPIYGMGYMGYAKKTGKSEKEAKDDLEAFFDLYPRVKAGIRETQKYCYDKGYIRTLIGKYLRIPNIRSKDNGLRSYAERQAFNYKIQGCLRYDSLIDTSVGKVEIEKLVKNKGVSLLQPNGTTSNFKVYSTGVKKCHEVHTTHGIVRCTEDHRFLAFEGGKLQFMKLADMKPGRFVAMFGDVRSHRLGKLSKRINLPTGMVLEIADLIRRGEKTRSRCLKRDVKMCKEHGIPSETAEMICSSRDAAAPDLLELLRKYSWAMVTEIKKARLAETFDIEILDEDHSYLSNGFVMHNSAADLLKMSMLLIDQDDRLKKLGAQMTLQIHDELLFNLPSDSVNEAKPLIEEYVSHPYRYFGIKDLAVDTPAEIGFGPNWQEAKQ